MRCVSLSDALFQYRNFYYARIVPFYFQWFTCVFDGFIIHIFTGSIIDLLEWSFIDIHQHNDATTLSELLRGEIGIGERDRFDLAWNKQLPFKNILCIMKE